MSVSFQAGGLLSVELYIDSVDADYNQRLFESIRAHQTALEAAYGRPLIWEDQPGRRYCRIADRTDGDVAETERHDELVDWIFDSMGRWRRALAELPREATTLVPRPSMTSDSLDVGAEPDSSTHRDDIARP